MDASAVNANLTVDDFDSVLSYADQSAWTTPDPSSASFNADASPFWMGTFHKTDVVGASFSFNFTGPAIFLYGHSGPSSGTYQVEIDSAVTELSAYSSTNRSDPYLLYGTNQLSYSKHTLTLRNLGKKNGDQGGNELLFDYLQTTVQLAPAGATVSNTTYQEDDPALNYTGVWNSNKSPNFSGGGTSYTNQDRASVSLSFHGSAIYVFGDKKNDHGLYSVTLDGNAPETYNGVSGCGGAFGMTCEQMKPTVKYFASNLDASQHALKIENLAGVNNSFFDLDSIVVTVPSKYAPRQLTPATPSSSSAPSSATSTGSGSNSAATVAAPPNAMALFLLLICSFFVLRTSFTHY